jgi:hypothetical protein
MTQISTTPESVAIDQVTISPLAQPRDGRVTIDVRLEGSVSPRWRRAFLLRLERGVTEFLARNPDDDPASRPRRLLASSDLYDPQLVHLRGRIDAKDAWPIVTEVVYPAIGAGAAGAAHELSSPGGLR